MRDAEGIAATKATLAAEPSPPVVPERFRVPMFRVIDDAFPEDWSREVGRWFYEHRDRLTAGGNEGVRFNYELWNLDEHCADLLVPFKRKLIEVASATETLEDCAVPEFDFRHLETHGTLYHHGSYFTWHDDVPGEDGRIVPSRRLTFVYYLHSDPKMFSGGELEFLDGTTVEPKNNRLCMFHPAQQHRVRPVECWSAALLHGRWALMGWIHGDPPEGWVERLPVLRGVPASG